MDKVVVSSHFYLFIVLLDNNDDSFKRQRETQGHRPHWFPRHATTATTNQTVSVLSLLTFTYDIVVLCTLYGIVSSKLKK
jgi:hypothetical protein